MTEEQKKKLEAQLWNIANTLRGKMNADEFRDYILGFIFYKYLSEKMHLYANGILKEDGIDFLDIDEASADGHDYLEAVQTEALDKLGYFLKPSELFSRVARRGNQKSDDGEGAFILGDLKSILTNIERSTLGTDSEDDFDKLFEDLDLGSTKLGRTESQKNDLIVKVLVHLDAIDFELSKSESDVLGDAYEYLIGQFASGAGKKAGEFYTPKEVSTILSKIVTTGKDRLKSVYDPACGSGSLLLRIARQAKVDKFYGQELNRTTYNLCRMNMILHDVHYRNFEIKQEDTLEHPQHDGMKFEAVVANPPFSADWSANPIHLSDDRFSQYGKLPPASKADFAFVQHMVHHLADNGIMAVVLSPGVLFRAASEGHIREYLIKDRNYLDAVIGLPDNIFYGTSIPTCILIFKKCREHGQNVLFINAKDGFQKNRNKNSLRQKDIDDIVSAYRTRSEIAGYSRRVTISEIAKNGYNINIPRYIDVFGDEIKVNLKDIQSVMSHHSLSMNSIEVEIKKYCDEIKCQAPQGYNIYLLKNFKLWAIQSLFSRSLRFRMENGGQFSDWVKTDISKTFEFQRTFSLPRDCLTDEEEAVQCIHYGDIHTKFKSHFYSDQEVLPYIIPGGISNDVPLDAFCRIGDLVIADASEDYADIGKSIEILDVKPNTVLAGLHTHLARPKKGKVALGFSGYMLQSEPVRKQIMTLAQGVSVLGISKKHLSGIELLLPHPDEQEKIAGFLLAIDRKIHAVSAKIT